VASPSATPSDIAPPAPAGPAVEPERLQAPQQDLEIAKASPPVEAPLNTLQQNVIDETTAFAADRSVMQWQPNWVEQDEYLRPVIVNPLPDPVQVVYRDGGDRRTLTIQPLTSAVIDVARGVYEATVIVINGLDQIQTVAATSLVSGLPPASDRDVPVVVHDKDVTYKPIVVDQVTDLGEDADVGMRRVLLDGATPAWGKWTQNTSGPRQFEIFKTQQLPGIDPPAAGKPPGYRLVADTEPLSSTDVFLIVVAALIAAVAVGVTIHHLRRPKRPPHVEARSRPGSILAVTVRETPGRGETTHSVRLATHSHPGTLTINEVNDDHTPA
jgi:hypothetical protein